MCSAYTIGFTIPCLLVEQWRQEFAGYFQFRGKGSEGFELKGSKGYRGEEGRLVRNWC